MARFGDIWQVSMMIDPPPKLPRWGISFPLFPIMLKAFARSFALSDLEIYGRSQASMVKVKISSIASRMAATEGP